MTSALARLADRLDPPQVDVFAMLGYVPTPRQAEFHAATEWDVFYGGSAGGGKSRALVADDIRDCVRYPGIRIGAFRRTFDELAESLLAELQAMDYAEALAPLWQGRAPRWTASGDDGHSLRFPNGSVIRYRYAETVEDASRRQGGGYQKLTIDERTLVPPEVIDRLAERLRSANRRIPVVGIRSGSNPGGPGHGRCRERFIDGTNHGQRTYVDAFGKSVRFIPARVSDNPHLDASYTQTLDAIPDPARRAAMRDGSWESFSGQVFTEWSYDRHVVKPFAVPREWRRWAGIDYGYAAPWAVLWGAQDQDRRVWVYRALHATGVGEAEQARMILEAEGGVAASGKLLRDPPERVTRLADPSMWNKVGDANPIAHTYALGGVSVAKATNDRLAGVQRVHSFLADGPACQLHRAAGLKRCPMLHVFDVCADLIRTLPNLPADPKRPEDVDTKADDHDFDALRYLLMPLGQPQAAVEHLPHEPVTLEQRVRADLERRRAGRSPKGGGVEQGMLGRY